MTFTPTPPLFAHTSRWYNEWHKFFNRFYCNNRSLSCFKCTLFIAFLLQANEHLHANNFFACLWRIVDIFWSIAHIYKSDYFSWWMQFLQVKNNKYRYFFSNANLGANTPSSHHTHPPRSRIGIWHLSILRWPLAPLLWTTEVYDPYFWSIQVLLKRQAAVLIKSSSGRDCAALWFSIFCSGRELNKLLCFKHCWPIQWLLNW